MNAPAAYPLAWPEDVPRTTKRQTSPFRVSLARAVSDLQDALRLFGQDTGLPVTNVLISSNVTLACQRPKEPGVAVYFEWDGAQRCIAVDRFPDPAANVHVIFVVLEGRRQELRYGGLHIVRAAFRGLTALPAPASADWNAVLGVGPRAPADEIQAAYKRRARQLSAEGDEAGLRALNVARDRAVAAAS